MKDGETFLFPAKAGAEKSSESMKLKQYFLGGNMNKKEIRKELKKQFTDPERLEFRWNFINYENGDVDSVDGHKREYGFVSYTKPDTWGEKEGLRIGGWETITKRDKNGKEYYRDYLYIPNIDLDTAKKLILVLETFVEIEEEK